MDSMSAFQLMIQDIPMLVGLLGVCLVVGLTHCRPVFYSSIACLVLLLFLFRNPMRLDNTVVLHPRCMMAPADGKIVNIAYAPDGSLDGYHYRISIIVSLLDVHINRVMSGGVVHGILHQYDADHARASVDVEVSGNHRRNYKMRHMVWPYLSHISCWPKVGDAVTTGQAYGSAVPRSRCDIFLPENVSLCVGIGQYVYAGTTKIGCWTA